MSWMMMLFSLLILPLLQPLTDYGSDKLQKTLGIKQVQQQQQQAPMAQPQPHIVYHEGLWWKFENGQWYVWRPQQ